MVKSKALPLTRGMVPSSNSLSISISSNFFSFGDLVLFGLVARTKFAEGVALHSIPYASAIFYEDSEPSFPWYPSNVVECTNHMISGIFRTQMSAH